MQNKKENKEKKLRLFLRGSIGLSTNYKNCIFIFFVLAVAHGLKLNKFVRCKGNNSCNKCKILELSQECSNGLFVFYFHWTVPLVLILLRLGFWRNFLSVLHPIWRTDRKFLRNPNLNEITLVCLPFILFLLQGLWFSVYLY